MPESKWAAQHENETITEPGRFHREFFYRCEFKTLRGSLLHQCCTVDCKLTPESPEDLFGATITLDCYALAGLELNAVAFDTLLALLASTKGNDRKRAACLELIEPERREAFSRQFETLERRLPELHHA